METECGGSSPPRTPSHTILRVVSDHKAPQVDYGFLTKKTPIKLWLWKIKTHCDEGSHVQKLFKIHYCHLTFFHSPLRNTPGESYVRSSQHSQRRWDCTAQIILLRKRIPQNVFTSNEVTMIKWFVSYVKDKTTPMKPLCSFDRRSSFCISLFIMLL